MTVAVAAEDVPEGTSAEAAMSAGLVEQREFTQDKIQIGAVASADQLRGLVAVVPIKAGQQLRVEQWGPAASASGLAGATS